MGSLNRILCRIISLVCARIFWESSEETWLDVDGGGRIFVAEEVDPLAAGSTGCGRRRVGGSAFVTDVSTPAYNAKLVSL